MAAGQQGQQIIVPFGAIVQPLQIFFELQVLGMLLNQILGYGDRRGIIPDFFGVKRCDPAAMLKILPIGDFPVLEELDQLRPALGALIEPFQRFLGQVIVGVDSDNLLVAVDGPFDVVEVAFADLGHPPQQGGFVFIPGNGHPALEDEEQIFQLFRFPVDSLQGHDGVAVFRFHVQEVAVALGRHLNHLQIAVGNLGRPQEKFIGARIAGRAIKTLEIKCQDILPAFRLSGQPLQLITVGQIAPVLDDDLDIGVKGQVRPSVIFLDDPVFSTLYKAALLGLQILFQQAVIEFYQSAPGFGLLIGAG